MLRYRPSALFRLARTRAGEDFSSAWKETLQRLSRHRVVLTASTWLINLRSSNVAKSQTT